MEEEEEVAVEVTAVVAMDLRRNPIDSHPLVRAALDLLPAGDEADAAAVVTAVVAVGVVRGRQTGGDDHGLLLVDDGDGHGVAVGAVHEADRQSA